MIKEGATANDLRTAVRPLDRGAQPVEGVVVGLLFVGELTVGWSLGGGDRAGALVAAVTDHARAARGVVGGPPLGDAGDEERGRVMAGAGHWLAHVGHPPVQV